MLEAFKNQDHKFEQSNSQAKLLKLADLLERELPLHKGEDAIFYGFVIMGIRHPTELVRISEANPNNEIVFKAMSAILELREDYFRETLEKA